MDTPEAIMAKKLQSALSELLEQVEGLEGFELSSALVPHEAEAVWDHTINRAKAALREARIVL